MWGKKVRLSCARASFHYHYPRVTSPPTQTQLGKSPGLDKTRALTVEGRVRRSSQAVVGQVDCRPAASTDAVSPRPLERET